VRSIASFRSSAGVGVRAPAPVRPRERDGLSYTMIVRVTMAALVGQCSVMRGHSRAVCRSLTAALELCGICRSLCQPRQAAADCTDNRRA
jgi:hypothetical protein